MFERFATTISAQFVMRLLVVSYFAALALGLIRGADMRLLMTPVLPTEIAHYVVRVLVLAFCGMILFGIFRRPAALLLSLLLFWASYIALYSGSDIGAFWRDLALIGALLLAGDVPQYATALGRPGEADEADPPEADTEHARRALRASDDRYREDLEVARTG